MKNFRKNQGITLIALVITVIVLLILAGVTIATLTGDNGILTRAQEAKNKTEQAQKDEENILDSYEDKINEYVGIDWDTVLANAKKHPEQTTSTAIGVGTDGRPVNMDLWEYTLLNDGTYSLNDEETLNNVELGGTNSKDIRSKGYNGEYTENGEIEGKIPQYISTDNGNTFMPVTDMYATFFHDANLKIAPIIPNTVVNMWNTFNSCINLVAAPEIPNSVTNMESTFFHCENLEKSPIISNNVTTMKTTFENCTSLTVAPEIPDNVTSLYGTFGGCTSLTLAPEIPNGVIDMFSTFRNCTSLTTAPTIPSSVEILVNTFRGCSNLQGLIEINAKVTGIQLGEDYYNYKDYGNCLYDACTTAGLTLQVTGECKLLQEIVTNANNANIKLK